MLRSRLIPCLLLNSGGLVKTVNFKDAKYVGDPLNAVRLFNEKDVDELIVLDIEASVKGKDPDYRLISQLAEECRMPLCYGGGIKSVEQAERIIRLGVEKVSICSAAIQDEGLVGKLAHRLGSQSVVVTLDVVKSKFLRRYQTSYFSNTKKVNQGPKELALRMAQLGAGEIVINSVTEDGTMSGYDLELLNELPQDLNVPVTMIGGAGSLDDVKALLKREHLIGAGAGSLFVFKGKYRAVLINYPEEHTKLEITTYR